MLGGLTARRLHAPPLAEEAAAGAPGLAGRAAAAARAALFAGGVSRGRGVAPDRGRCEAGAWRRVRHGPLPRRALPPVSRPGWTLLVQGLDLHDAAAHAMLRAFRFVPDARLDDLMMSWASDGGGVGPHLDSLRRVPAAGAGPAPLAHRPAAAHDDRLRARARR
jgi:50S ribosomal protein L16 3-hydroxylase